MFNGCVFFVNSAAKRTRPGQELKHVGPHPCCVDCRADCNAKIFFDSKFISWWSLCAVAYATSVDEVHALGALQADVGKSRKSRTKCCTWHDTAQRDSSVLSLLAPEQGLCHDAVSVRLSVCLSVPAIDGCSSMRCVCCCGPGGQEISIDCCTAGAQHSPAAKC